MTETESIRSLADRKRTGYNENRTLEISGSHFRFELFASVRAENFVHSSLASFILKNEAMGNRMSSEKENREQKIENKKIEKRKKKKNEDRIEKGDKTYKMN